MAAVKCPGLPAFWVNGWLAAVGATVLVPGMRLRWSPEQTPVAVLSVDEGDPVALLLEAWPSKELLEDLPVANCWRDTSRFPRNVPAGAFAARVLACRSHSASWSIASTLTDLLVDERDVVGHARFNPPAPQGKTLWDRLMAAHGKVTPTAERLAESLDGRAARVHSNGLGFDIGRLGSLADEPGKLVDPAVEVLAFFGLAVFPVRGPGVDVARGGRRGERVAQRGWLPLPGSTQRETRFVWPAWHPSFDQSAIDALLDLWRPDQKETWVRLGVRAGWRSANYRRRALQDVTRAIGSERL